MLVCACWSLEKAAHDYTSVHKWHCNQMILKTAHKQRVNRKMSPRARKCNIAGAFWLLVSLVVVKAPACAGCHVLGCARSKHDRLWAVRPPGELHSTDEQVNQQMLGFG